MSKPKIAYKVVCVDFASKIARSATGAGTSVRYFKDGRLIRAPKESPCLFVFTEKRWAENFKENRNSPKDFEVWEVQVRQLKKEFRTSWGRLVSLSLNNSWPYGTVFTPTLRMIKKVG